ncbi:MAG: hypothetical protein ACJ74Y_14330 [Bryobacteraceae bacterium]|jgi:hypothetical protein
MARIQWPTGSYRDGVDQGVIFPANEDAEAWNGLISVHQTPADLRTRVRYRDGVKVVNQRSEESFSATIKAYTYPVSLIPGLPFGFSYRVLTESGYRLHLVYNARAKWSDATYENETPIEWSFDITTTPIAIPGAKPSAHLIVNETAYSSARAQLEDVLYGTEVGLARLPNPQEIFDIFEANSILRVVDNGDGTFTVTGPDDAITMLDDTTFEINWPSVVVIDSNTYEISSL